MSTINKKSVKKRFVHCSLHLLLNYQAGNFCRPKCIYNIWVCCLEGQIKCGTLKTDYFGQCEMMNQLYLSMRGKVNILKLNLIQKRVCYILSHYSQLLLKNDGLCNEFAPMLYLVRKAGLGYQNNYFYITLTA